MQINLTPDWSLLAIMAIFIANYFVVRRFFFAPINQVLAEREEEVRSAEAIFEDAMSRFHEATTRMESRIQEARRKGSEIRESHRGKAATFRNEMLDKSRREAEQSVQSAESELRSSAAAAREKLTRESEALARFAAEKILGRKIA